MMEQPQNNKFHNERGGGGKFNEWTMTMLTVQKLQLSFIWDKQMFAYLIGKFQLFGVQDFLACMHSNVGEPS